MKSPTEIFETLSITTAPTAPPGPRLGSFWFSDIESFDEAWRRLLPATSQLACPILYLQRHTFELLVKDLLTGVLEMREQSHILDELLGTEDGAGPVDPQDVDKAYSKHQFDVLFPCLKRNLNALRFPDLPREFDEAKRLFFDVDGDRPDKLRYDVQFDKKTREKYRSFPHDFDQGPVKYAPCAEIATVLSTITAARKRQLDNHVDGRQRTETSDLDGFYDFFWDACRDSEHEVTCRLGEIVKATRNGAAVWRDAALACKHAKGHPVFGNSAEYFDECCLETDYHNRVLVLAVSKEVLPRGELLTEDELYLAVRRPDGSLTQGVWFNGYQSELAREVILSLTPRNPN
jgi:hypothetical protein